MADTQASSASAASSVPEHLTNILDQKTQEAISAYPQESHRKDKTIHSFKFVFPTNEFHVGAYIFPFATQNQEHLLSYKYKWTKKGEKDEEVVLVEDLWYRPVVGDVGHRLTFACLDSEGKNVVESLVTEPILASSQPVEKPRCFFAQSQLMAEVQYIQNKLSPKNFGNVTELKQTESSVSIGADCKLDFNLSAISTQIWKFELTTNSEFIQKGPNYSVLESSANKREKLNVSPTSGETADIRVADPIGAHVTATVNKSPFSVQYHMISGSESSEHQKSLLQTSEVKWLADEKRNFVEITLQVGEGAQIYGLGERTAIKKNNKKFYMWNDDAYAYRTHTDPLYHCYPFAMFVHPKTRQFHAFYFDNPGFQVWDCGDSSIKISALNGLSPFRYYVIGGESPQAVLRNYSFLTGCLPLPPLWVLGYQQCRWSYYPDSRVREIASSFRKCDIPCDVLWLDIDYMDGFRCFTWDSEKFPSPSGLISWLHEKHFKVVCMIDPAIKEDPKYWVYNELMAGSHFCALPSSLASKPQPFVGSVWAGPSVFPDYTQPHTREWWGGLYKEMIEQGVDGFWNDMNEPTIFFKKEDSVAGWVQQSEGSHRNLHNLYGMLMARSTYEGLKKLQPNKRPFVLSRAGCAGVQRYAWMWTGDNRSIWKDLRLSIPMCLGMGLSGVPGCGVDIGGFSETCTPELYARFIQLGSLLPLSRTHSMTGTPDQEPWSFGDSVEEVARKHIKLRYQLIPYMYTQLYIATKEGTPIMRPIWFDRPRDVTCYEPKWEDTQFMLGSALLVAPVLYEGATTREVYLPGGNRWVNFYTKEVMDGGKVITVEAPLDVLPLFVAENSVIPMFKEAKENIQETRKTGLKFECFGNPDLCKGEIYLDDGESRDFEKGNFVFQHITKDGIQDVYIK